MYNKTALKKIKKDDLVQMYLDLQAKNYDDKMEEVLEKCCNNAIDETVKELQKENEKLEEEIKELQEEAEQNKEFFDTTFGEFMKLKAENKKLKEEINEWEEEVSSIQSTSESLEWNLKEEIKKLKEWSLSAKMIEDTSAETIEEFEQDVRDAWAEGTLDGREEEIEKLKEEVDTWHKALDEKVEGLEHLQSEINLHFWRRCKGPWDTNVEKINQN
tara:strand:- start:11189 stop:11836 length:648 start_codon:yes stop_codon:yes gene_type:complete